MKTARNRKRVGLRKIARDGRLILSTEGRAVGTTEIRRMRNFLGRQKMTVPVVGNMRRRARY